ncbi:MAG: endonuclease domain-containing protein [Gallionella sp.]
MKSEKQTPLNPPLYPQGVRRRVPRCSAATLSQSGGKRTTGAIDIAAGIPVNLPLSGEGTPSPDKGRPGGVKGFIPYNKKLTALARENRKNPTAAENKLWNEVLRMRHFVDYKFSRQKPVGNYIVDFYCAQLKLAIEIDGDSHADAVAHDALRTDVLNDLGVSVIRYTNHDVMHILEGVYDDLANRVAQICAGVYAQ